MFEADDVSGLVSNIINGKKFSHCRLCFKELYSNYVKLNDLVCLNIENCSFKTLSSLLSDLLHSQICQDIPGLEAVCAECAHKAIEVYKFLETSRNSLNFLNSVFTDIDNSLNIDLQSLNNKSLYLIVNQQEIKVVVMPTESILKKGNIKEFECIICEEVYDDSKQLDEHNLSIHSTLVCQKCDEKFSNETDLNFHRNICHFKCFKCNIYMTTESALQDHQERAHNIHMCSECGKSYKGLDKLELHRNKHNTKNECPKCGKTYNTKDFFVKHVKLCLAGLIDPHPTRSEILKPFICDKCGKGYSTPGGLRVHDRFEHEGAMPHVCKHCGKKFTAPSYLRIHMVKHTGEKNFKCNICNNKFVSKEALLYHTRRHTGERPYTCKLCEERFVNASSRAEHIKFKHIGPTLKCDICLRKFVTAHFLKQHINRHHDPTSKLYTGRSQLPPNVPGQHNMRVKIEVNN